MPLPTAATNRYAAAAATDATSSARHHRQL